MYFDFETVLFDLAKFQHIEIEDLSPKTET